jgi:hypothetical protein
VSAQNSYALNEMFAIGTQTFRADRADKRPLA